MRKFFTFIFIIFLFAGIINAQQEQQIKINLLDGSTKSYNLSEIENMNIIKTISNFEMKIHYQDSKVEIINTSKVDSIKFELLNNIIKYLAVFPNNDTKKSFLLFDIDSIVFVPLKNFIITEVIPTTAKINDLITINGIGFGASQGPNYVDFAGIRGTNFQLWSDKQIKVNVPYGAVSGKLTVVVNDIKSNEIDFHVQPNISSINPATAAVGDFISILGSGFGKTQGNSIVSFEGGDATEFESWADTKIRVKVPSNAKAGKLSVTVGGIKSNEVGFAIGVKPVISGIDPEEFSVGQSVTINGSNFGASQGSSKVTFNTANAYTISSWSNYKIVCTVPIGAETGKLFVTVNNVKSNEVDFKMLSSVASVLIPNGSFNMGNTGSMGDGPQSEKPVHQVTISNDFYMSTYEVTQALYSSIMGSNPSNFKGDNLPVERVSFLMAADFCNKLSEKEGLEKCYSINGSNVTCNWDATGWRLPTEAEWEYACKAGTTTDFYNGNSASNFGQIAWYSDNAAEQTHPVGGKKPNAWGLYDMLGNVSEVCWDWVGNYSGSSQTDPKGENSGTWKIARGGSWHNNASYSRSSMRGWIDAINMQSSAMGFRIVRLK